MAVKVDWLGHCSHFIMNKNGVVADLNCNYIVFIRKELKIS